MKVNINNTEVELPKWLILGLSLFLVFCISLIIYDEVTKVRDSDLADKKESERIQDQFEKELKNLATPPKTAINKLEIGGKQGYSIKVTARYRTEIEKDELRAHFKKELEKNGWKFYGTNSKDSFVFTDVFCRGKFDAQLSLESWNIWSDGA